MTTMHLAGDVEIDYDGARMKVRDIPDRDVRVLLGFGHPDRNGRPLAPGDWPYPPEECEIADQWDAFKWDTESKVLRCTGCGVDGT